MTVRFDRDALGLGAGVVSARNARTDAECTVREDRFTVRVEGRNYTFIELE